jgi:hypothetical protein
MSWIDDVVDFGKSAIGAVGGFLGGGGGLGGNILKTVLTGMALNKVTKSVTKSNDATSNAKATAAIMPVDTGVRIQTSANTEAKIPVLYGRANFGGSLIDARMTADNKIMYYVYALCENTGTVLSTGVASVISLKNVYWSGQRIVFKGDGITADYMTDRDGKVDKSIRDLVQVYCYKKGSATQIFATGFSGSSTPAYNIVPNWNSNWTLDNMAFVVIKITYSKEKGVQGVGNMTFDLENSMTMPGDVLYDMMTNTMYGAGIAPADIKAG